MIREEKKRTEKKKNAGKDMKRWKERIQQENDKSVEKGGRNAERKRERSVSKYIKIYKNK